MVEKQYETKNFYYAIVHTISEPYEKYCPELQIETLFHSQGEKEYTLLLKEGEKWVDLLHPDRKFYIPRDGEEKSYGIRCHFPLEEYYLALGINKPTCTIKETRHIVRKNPHFFAFYTDILQEKQTLEERVSNGATLIRKNSITEK